MNLSKRLQCVAANVGSKGVVADIGCDHGFTSIYLVQRGLAKRAIALDINQGPLERAKEHIEQYHMQDKITVRLSDGAKNLLPNEADTLLISGMGGALISRILKESIEVTKSSKELILSPQSEIFMVRQTIHELGFQIVQEKMIIDQNKFYVIMRAVPGQEKYQEEWEYIYGKKLVEDGSGEFCKFIEKELKRVDKVLALLKEQKLSQTGLEKKKKVEKEKSHLLDIWNRIQ